MEHEDSSWNSLIFQLTIVLCIYGIVGALGNTLILVVYLPRKAKLFHSTYIRTLATVDLIVCCVIVPYTIVFEQRKVTDDVLCRGMEVLRHTLVISSNQILCVIAVERYLSLFRPTRMRTVRKANISMAIVFINSFIVAIPSVTIFTVTEATSLVDPGVASSISANASHNETGAPDMTTKPSQRYCQFSNSLVHPTWALTYQCILALEFFLTVFIMAAIYIRVYKEIWRREQWRNGIMPKVIRSTRLFKNRVRLVKNATLNQMTIREPLWSVTERQCHLPVEANGVKSCSSQVRNIGQSGTTGNVTAALEDRDQGVDKVDKPEPAPKEWLSIEALRNNYVLSSDTDLAGKRNGKISATENSRIASRLYSHIHGKNNSTTNQIPRSIPDNQIQRSKPDNQIPRSRPDNRRKAGTMLFICTLIYTATWLTFWIDVFNVTSNLVFRYTFMVGYATNPIVYGVVNAKVREELKRVILCRQHNF